jgi:hypothetical protein
MKALSKRRALFIAREYRFPLLILKYQSEGIFSKKRGKVTITYLP